MIKCVDDNRPRASRTAACLTASLLIICGCSPSSDSDTPKLPVKPSEQLKNAEQAMLSDAERKYLWDTEHLGFVLEQTVFPIFKQGLRERDFEPVRVLLSDDFRAALPRQETIIERAGIFRLTKSNTMAEQPLESDAAAFSEWLRTLRSRFDDDGDRCSVSVGLVRLLPEVRGDLDGRWTTIWKLRLAGHRKQQPVDITTWVKLTLSSLSDDIAGKASWIVDARVQRFEWIESPTPLFVEMTGQTGIDNSLFHDNWDEGETFIPNTGGVYVSDYDLDGDLDLLVDDRRAGARLYRNSGQGTFEDVTESSGLGVSDEPPLWTQSLWADFDGDADDDLIIEGQLFRNDGDGSFTEVTEQSNLPLLPATGYSIADFDRDGRVDLYVTHSGAYRPGQSTQQSVSWIDDGLGIDNVLWRNLGGWQFEDVTESVAAGAGGSSSFASVWLDANDDLIPDVFAINEFGRNSLLVSGPGGRFSAAPIDPVFGGFSMGVTAGDVNNDGRTDLYVSNMYSKAGNRILANVDRETYPAELYAKIVEATTGNKLYLGSDDSSFEPLSPEKTIADIGWAYGASMGDLDGDGWLDIAVTAGFKSVTRGKPDG